MGYESIALFHHRRQEKSRRFRAVYVFDLAQTDGEDLPAAPSVQGDAAGRFRRTCLREQETRLRAESLPSFAATGSTNAAPQRQKW
jgi:hypothetical protein